MMLGMAGVIAWIMFPGRGAAEEEPVAAVQALLREERLYDGPVNGTFDLPTVAGVRRYQIVHGLRASGRLDEATLHKMLGSPVPPESLAESDRRLLHELAQTPVTDPLADYRKPLPPIELPEAVAQRDLKATKAAPQENKRKRVKPTRPHRAPEWSASD
jgi:peptidoglycan hydrolase-like protein with peptidoglycan-binding domain